VALVWRLAGLSLILWFGVSGAAGALDALPFAADLEAKVAAAAGTPPAARERRAR
jgi:hypothetical protein